MSERERLVVEPGLSLSTHPGRTLSHGRQAGSVGSDTEGGAGRGGAREPMSHTGAAESGHSPHERGGAPYVLRVL